MGVMKKTYFKSRIVIILLLLSASLFSQRFTSVVDTYIDQAIPGSSYGTTGNLMVRQYSGFNRISFLEFNVDSFNEQVSKAELCLHISGITNTGTETIDVYEVTSGTAADNCTWTGFNAGFTLSASPVASISFNETAVNSWCRFNITTLVNTVAALGGSNKRIKLALKARTTTLVTYFYTAESAYPQYAPFLVMTPALSTGLVEKSRTAVVQDGYVYNGIPTSAYNDEKIITNYYNNAGSKLYDNANLRFSVPTTTLTSNSKVFIKTKVKAADSGTNTFLVDLKSFDNLADGTDVNTLTWNTFVAAGSSTYLRSRFFDANDKASETNVEWEVTDFVKVAKTGGKSYVNFTLAVPEIGYAGGGYLAFYSLNYLNTDPASTYIPQIVVYAPASTITSFTPSTGVAGTVVTITGTNLTGATAVSFGGVAASSFTVDSDTQITATVAAVGSSGVVSVTTVGSTATLSGFVFNQTITFNSLSAKLTTDPTFALTATSNSGLTVTYTSSNLAVATVSGSTVTMVGAGTTSITASQAGNAYVNSATPAQQTLIVALMNTISNGSGVTSTLSSCPTCDVTVTSAGTLTVDATATINNLILDAGGKLLVSNPLTVKDITFKADKTSSFSAKLANTITIIGTVRLLKTIDDTRWYFMSFPCAVPVASITRSDGVSLGVLGTDWFIKYYDGAQRIQNLGASSNWKNFVGASLSPYVGYIFGLAAAGDKELLIPIVKDSVKNEPARLIPVVAHGDGVTTNLAGQTVAASHKGWNLIGQPYFSKFSGTNAGVNYMNLFDGYSYTAYANTDVASLDPFAAYFVQADAALASTGVSFNLVGRQSAPKSVANDLNDKVKIVVSTATGTDNTNLIIAPNQSSEYQIGQDMEKWITTGTSNPQLYSCLNGVNYAYNALPIESVQNLPLGIYSKYAGSSTISADFSNAPGLSQLLLMDNFTGDVTDLTKSNYSFNIQSGANNNRFSISAQQEIVTNTGVADTNTVEATGVYTEENKIIVSARIGDVIKIYSSHGQMIRSVVAVSDKVLFSVDNGIYIVSIGNKKSKVLVK